MDPPVSSSSIDPTDSMESGASVALASPSAENGTSTTPLEQSLPPHPTNTDDLIAENKRLKEELSSLKELAEVTKQKVKVALENLVKENESLKARIEELEMQVSADGSKKTSKRKKKKDKSSPYRHATTSRAFGKKYAGGKSDARSSTDLLSIHALSSRGKIMHSPRKLSARPMTVHEASNSAPPLRSNSMSGMTSYDQGRFESPHHPSGGILPESGDITLSSPTTTTTTTTDTGGSPQPSPARGPSKLAKLLGSNDDILDEASKKLSAEGGTIQDTDGVLLVKDVTGQRHVRGGTQEGLIKLLYSKDVIRDFEDAYLVTYPAFTTMDFVLEHLMNAYSKHSGGSKEQKQCRSRILDLLMRWFKDQPAEFHSLPYDLRQQCRSWCTDCVKREDGTSIAAKALKCFPITPYVHHDQMEKKKMAKSIIPSSPIVEWTILSIDPKEIARQLTMMEYAQFSRIRPKEYLKCAWTKPDKATTSPNLLSVIDTFNNINRWIQHLIVQESDLRVRATIYEHVADVAKALRKMNNFSALISVASAFDSSPVHRLHKTKEAANKKKIAQLDALCKEVRSENSYRHYRDVFTSSKYPKIPYMGLFMTDMTNIHEVMYAVLEEKKTKGYMNFEKYAKMASVISQVQGCQRVGFPFLVVHEIQSFIRKGFTIASALSENDLFDLSLSSEPREKKNRPV